jgi:hypothetical protein
MKNLIKPGCLLLIVLSLTLVWTDNVFFSCFPNALQHECGDISGHVDTSHTHGVEDQLLTAATPQKPTIAPGLIHNVPALQDIVKNNYFASIWQPPKYC